VHMLNVIGSRIGCPSDRLRCDCEIFCRARTYQTDADQSIHIHRPEI
jgi:hypothetical protein